jgi:FtsP/CotA-like multicopper oxidase with cupredoxin domain
MGQSVSQSGLVLTRRAFLGAGAAGVAAAAVSPPRVLRADPAESRVELVAASARTSLVGAGYPDTAVWAYSGTVPGPEIRLRQGERLTVRVTNLLDEPTTVHWHGLRVPNAMDGVPHLTQQPIQPGETFTYGFDVPDAGTYWYHPHQRSFEQVGRGLYGPLIVEEREPIRVDRELTWVLDDWRLTKDAAIAGGFGGGMDMSHGGRLGNVVTVNGRIVEDVPVLAGERVRLRLINAANARTFALHFEGHAPRVIALDGQPVTPHEPVDGRVILGSAMRADVVLDMTSDPGARFRVIDDFYPRRAYRLLDLAYRSDAPVRSAPLDAPIRLAANTMPEPDVAGAKRHRITLAGGMMGGLTGAMMDGKWHDIREMMHDGKMWAINGFAATGHVMEPLVTLRRNASYVLEMVNDTAWHHPIHLHGHSFRVIARDGRPTEHREWQDTVLMAPRERVDIAFVADNPGDWMFHCHILEHQAGGMMGVIRVTDGDRA